MVPMKNPIELRELLQQNAPEQAHAPLSPSSADKWLTCHGWLKAVEPYRGKGESSIYADEGTLAHEILDTAFLLDSHPEDLTDNEEMQDALGLVFEWVQNYMVEHPGGYYLSEVLINWGNSIQDSRQSGTADLIIVNPEELVVVDLKYGAGVVVEPTTPQLRCYLIGLHYIAGQRNTYKTVIAQPRIKHKAGPIRTHTYTTRELREFKAEVKNAAIQNYSTNGKRVAGKHCRWCPAAPNCKALADFSLSLAAEDFRREDAKRGSR